MVIDLEKVYFIVSPEKTEEGQDQKSTWGCRPFRSRDNRPQYERLFCSVFVRPTGGRTRNGSARTPFVKVEATVGGVQTNLYVGNLCSGEVALGSAGVSPPFTDRPRLVRKTWTCTEETSAVLLLGSAGFWSPTVLLFLYREILEDNLRCCPRGGVTQ